MISRICYIWSFCASSYSLSNTPSSRFNHIGSTLKCTKRNQPNVCNYSLLFIIKDISLLSTRPYCAINYFYNYFIYHLLIHYSVGTFRFYYSAILLLFHAPLYIPTQLLIFVYIESPLKRNAIPLRLTLARQYKNFRNLFELGSDTSAIERCLSSICLECWWRNRLLIMTGISASI
jgi:hypothetical protein